MKRILFSLLLLAPFFASAQSGSINAAAVRSRVTDSTTVQTPTGYGVIYYNAQSNKFRVYQNGAWTNLTGGGGGGGGGISPSDNVTWTGTASWRDNNFSLFDNADLTKIGKFELSGITTATTRTLTWPNASGTLALTSDIPSLSTYVVGPASAVNNRVAFFDGTTGKLIKDSGLTLSGSNTGDQTITLTGELTGSGTGSFATTLAKTAITNRSLVTAASGDHVLISDVSDSGNLKKVLVSDLTGGGGSMVYPGAGIALSTGSAWGTSITDNSSNWNTAFGWGNHASAGYLSSLTNGSGTTASGSAVNLGGNVSGDVSIDSDVAGTRLFQIGNNRRFSRVDAVSDVVGFSIGGTAGTYRSSFSGDNSSIFFSFTQNPITLLRQIGLDANGVTINTLQGSDATGDTYYRNSSGYFTRLPAGTNGHVLTLAAGLPSWAAPSAGALSALTAATGTNTINNADNAQGWQWNTLGSGTGLTLSSSSTAAASNTNTLFKVTQTGANATSSQTTTAVSISNTKTGTSANNRALYLAASGGAGGANYALWTSGPAYIEGLSTSDWVFYAKAGGLNQGIYLGPTGSLLSPIQNNATDLGDASTRFRTLYLQSNIIIGASSYINFNTTAGSSGYGIRDNAGTMEFKNSGGSWTAFGAGGGNVTKVGTPVDNQIGVWTGDGTIEGTTGLTYDGSNFQLTGDIGSTGTRITKGWYTDLQVTNAIAGSITGNAATVTTNANLTGHVTSTGNATTLGSFTVAQLSAALSDANISGDNSGDQALANTSDATSHTVTLTGGTSVQLIEGSNITLTTGGTGSAGTITIASTGAGYTNLTSFVDQTAWRVFYSNASGDVTELALGASGTYLKSNGASSAPTWNTALLADGTYGAINVGSSGTVFDINAATVGITQLSASGTPSASTYLRGDNTWATVSGGSGLTYAQVSALSVIGN